VSSEAPPHRAIGSDFHASDFQPAADVV